MEEAGEDRAEDVARAERGDHELVGGDRMVVAGATMKAAQQHGGPHRWGDEADAPACG